MMKLRAIYSKWIFTVLYFNTIHKFVLNSLPIMSIHWLYRWTRKLPMLLRIMFSQSHTCIL